MKPEMSQQGFQKQVFNLLSRSKGFLLHNFDSETSSAMKFQKISQTGFSRSCFITRESWKFSLLVRFCFWLFQPRMFLKELFLMLGILIATSHRAASLSCISSTNQYWRICQPDISDRETECRLDCLQFSTDFLHELEPIFTPSENIVHITSFVNLSYSRIELGLPHERRSLSLNHFNEKVVKNGFYS